MTFRLKTLRRSSQLPKQAILKNTSRKIFEKSPEAKENTASRSRPNSIDFLRGLVMVVMALITPGIFFAAGGFNPRDVTEPALFLTRWITRARLALVASARGSRSNTRFQTVRALSADTMDRRDGSRLCTRTGV
jgi:hypothetical protein